MPRLGQAEKFLRRALDADESRPDAWNNLGVILLEKGETAEAVQIFRKAYALDNGDSDMIRDNLRLALAKLENPSYDEDQAKDFVDANQTKSLVAPKKAKGNRLYPDYDHRTY